MYKNKSTLLESREIAKISIKGNVIQLSGNWIWSSLSEDILNIKIKPIDDIIIDASQITYFDTTGAYFIKSLRDKFSKSSAKIQIKLNPEEEKLFSLVSDIEHYDENKVHPNEPLTFTQICIEKFNNFIQVFVNMLSMYGQICYSLLTIFKKESSVYMGAIASTISSAGLGGILITSTLCFLIGVNLTYQMAPQFVTYGANVYVVNFLGISLLREVTPLLTAVIVAGRSGSAIAAYIGTMKVQEEIDALKTMGVSPMRYLVLPRVIGLIISLPILTMLADVASMLGGMIFAGPLLGVEPGLFIERVQTSVSINNFWVGILKSFFFAGIIGMVSCYCGLQVKSNADSIGTQTTRSVVLSICLIIFIDALFAIVLKMLGVN